MIFGHFKTRLLVRLGSAVTVVLGFTLSAHGQNSEDRQPLREPVYRVPAQPAAQPRPEQPREKSSNKQVELAAAQEHPLMPALRMAKSGLARIDEEIKDYSCTFVKRENINGTVMEHEYMFLKVRHEPFSVYMYFLAPASMKGRECIYVEGKNDNKLIAHEGGSRIKAALPTVRLDPKGLIAMRNQRYAITEVGIRNLTARLIEVAQADTKFGECDVKFFKGAKINGRECTCVQVVHPVPRKNFRYHLARVYIDDELQIPIRFESYNWPTRRGDPPTLLEEYTYMNVKINNDFTDADFDESNKQYGF